MKRHPKIGKPVLINIYATWVIGYHLGTVRSDGAANYFVSAKSSTFKRLGGCYWLKPAAVKQLRRDSVR